MVKTYRVSTLWNVSTQANTLVSNSTCMTSCITGDTKVWARLNTMPVGSSVAAPTTR